MFHIGDVWFDSVRGESRVASPVRIWSPQTNGPFRTRLFVPQVSRSLFVSPLIKHEHVFSRQNDVAKLKGNGSVSACSI
jgi:hypothetical protein